MNTNDSLIAPELFDLPPHNVTSGTVYPDGWCVPYMCVHFPDIHGLVRINVEFWNPTMIDLVPNDVVIRANHRAIASFANLSPEQIEAVQHEMNVVGDRGLTISIRSAGRCPQSANDVRPLALVIRHLSVGPVRGTA